MPHRQVLLTGAAGVVGDALLDELTDHDVTSLVHRTPVERPGVRSVRGDLGQPRAGLDAGAWRELADRVDAVVHTAAVTDFSADRDTVFRSNVEGARTALELARAADAPLFHLSTAFVARRHRVREVEGAAADPTAYLDSKLEAEQLVLGSGHPVVVVRPSLVIGHSWTGEMTRFQGLHTLAGAILRQSLPLLPLDEASRVDYLPRDTVARAVAGLLRSGCEGGEYWVTAGAGAPTARQLIDQTLALAAEIGVPEVPPRLVSPDMVDRLIRPVFIEPLDQSLRRRFDDMMSMTALFDEDVFPCSIVECGCAAPARDDLLSSFARSMRHWARVKHLAPELQEVAA